MLNNFNNIPTELKNCSQWVLWRKEKRNGKLTKVPYQVNSKIAQANNRNTWSSFEMVVEKYKQGGYDGIGFVFSKQDDYVGIDLDKCCVDGDLSELAQEIMNIVPSYTEYSPSGKGIHIIAKGKIPLRGPGTGKKVPSIGLEVYRHTRYFTFTGDSINNHPVEESTENLKVLFQKYIEKKEVPAAPKTPYVSRKSNISILSDAELWERMFDSKSGAAIKDLFQGILINGDHSSTDMALCNHLAFWTDKDASKMDSMFRESALIRDKWDKPHSSDGRTYGEMTIEKAIESTHSSVSDYNRSSDYNRKNDVHYLVNEQVETNGIKKGSWWSENNGRTSFLHHIMVEYILQENKIVRFPNEDGDIYVYNKATGIYELDKTCRKLRSLVRDAEILKRNQVREVQEYIMDMSPVVNEESKNYIAVENGLLHLDSMQFKEFTPDVFVTKKIPTKYNSKAFDSFVEKTLMKVSDGHLPTIKNIHEMFGAVLYPTLLVPKMFYLYGRSAHNGKSTVLYMIQKTFNSGDNISAISPQKLAENAFAGSSIYGKLANIVDDQPDEVIRDSGTLKTIITGGYVDIEFKGKSSQTVQMNTVCITASNHYPNFREHGNQINKRLHILPFDHNFMNDPDRISEMESMKQLETVSAKEYVLKLAVDAIKDMKQRTADILTYNEKAEEAKQNFMEYNDPLADFFFEYDKRFFEEVRGTDALKAYDEWCKDNHVQHPLGQKQFKDSVCTKYEMEWKDKMTKINGSWKTVKGFKSKPAIK
ncbi:MULTISPECIES: phage/plasmid primase, P4 family [Bacillus cereus group]|uniref:phage/plasmid primase, P4 family n=1 Tax=Bacillus cereus group TaxID=86661 RepID=UPI000BEC8168|nr:MULTISPECIES: phage/plasmid primase, P4 family [Bacillus cereus group]PEG03933.1 DNA primase [Bacillus cereus]PGS60080.1 DNA primase [Bacillus cereus]PGW53447.1 DNA primase [Bacillus thuringiensis]